MAFAMDTAISDASKAVDVSGIGKDTTEGLQMGMSLAQRQQQLEQQRQALQFQSEQNEMQKHDWLHAQLGTALGENNPQLRKVYLDSLNEQFPKVFDGKRMDPATLKAAEKVPSVGDALLAAGRIRSSMMTNHPEQIKQMDMDVMNGLTGPTSENLKQILGAPGLELQYQKFMMQQQQNEKNNQFKEERIDQGNTRIDIGQNNKAQATVNNDPLLKQYLPRLDGAAKINDLIESAKSGKVVPNSAFLGQLNAEMSRLETGSQSPGLGASEKTELTDASAKLAKLKEYVTGNPSDIVSPGLIKQAQGTINELSDSYMNTVDNRFETLKSGATDAQQQIIGNKHETLKGQYRKRFGRWAGDSDESAQTPAGMGATKPPIMQAQQPKITNDVKSQALSAAQGRLQQLKSAPPGTLNFTEQQVKDVYKQVTGSDFPSQ